MPILQPRRCATCGRTYEVVLHGIDVDDLSRQCPEEFERLFRDLLGSRWGQFAPDPTPQVGALFRLEVDDLSAVARYLPGSRAWLIRYTIRPTAAELGGRFELRFGPQGAGGTRLVVRMPAGIRAGAKLRAPGVCPGGTDLLIELDVRELPKENFLGKVLDICRACEERDDRVLLAAEARREQLRALLPQLGALIGFGLFVLMCLVLGAIFG